MKLTTKLLAIFLAAMMLFSVLPLSVFAANSYTVTLKRGPEGAGTTSKKLTKTHGVDLELKTVKNEIKSAYGMYPSAGGSGFGKQRVFIEWNTEIDPTTGKGIGKAYRNVYNVDADITLYAVWGFEIQYNADGGCFPSTGNDVFLRYVVDCDDNNYQNPKTLYGNFDLPEGSNAPTKDGCRRVTLSSGADFYGLLYPSMKFFTTESAKQNLTIPPTGGKLPWSSFHTTTTATGNTAPEFYAIWEPSVTYKANGGSGDDYTEYLTWDWSALYSYEDYTVMTANDAHDHFTIPRKQVGSWNTKPDGSGKSYKVGQVINQLSSSDPIVLYAQWVNAPTYSVNYNANGGEDAPAKQTKYTNEQLILTEDIPTREGYSFHGWATSASAAKASKKPAGTYNKNANITYYAFWQNAAEHPVTVDVIKEATCSQKGYGNYLCETCGYTYTASIPSPEHSFGPFGNTETGYISRSCLDCGYTEKQALSYNISYYDAMGSDFSGSFSTTAPIVHTYGYTTALPTAEKTHFTFGGWYSDPECTGDAVTSIGATEYAKDIALFALWIPESYSITYKDYNNKTLTGKLPEGYATKHFYGMDTALPTPERAGYSFCGWYTDKACKGEAVSVITADMINGDITLYAKWETASYTITYLDMDSSAFTGIYNAKTPFSHTYGKATKLYNPTKEGYSFCGWYTEAGKKVTSLAKTSYTADITLYAKWEAESYKISYKDQNNKSFSGKMPKGYATTHTYDSVTTLATPEKKGYTFCGWYSDKACTMPITEITEKQITKAITVYAKWDVNVYTISYFDRDGGEFSGVYHTSTPTTHTYGVATKLYNPTKEGYTFNGWYTEAGKKVTSLAKTSYTEDINLYASWSVNSYKISYKDCNNKSFSGKNPSGYATKHIYDTVTTLPVPTKKGYIFCGWYTDKLCQTSPVTTLGEKDVTSAITLYAKWEAEVYSITYVLDSTNRATASVSFGVAMNSATPYTHTYGKKTDLKSPTRTGYTFVGWYTEAGKKVTSLSATGYTEDIVLYAKWK